MTTGNMGSVPGFPKPGVNIELNSKKKVIGIEVIQASKVLRAVIPPLAKKIRAA